MTNHRLLYVFLTVFGCLVIFIGICIDYTQTPNHFPLNEELVIEKGTGVREATELLYENNIIRSPLVFQIVLSIFFDDSSIKAESYFFPKELDAFEVAEAITEGKYTAPLTVVTIQEGLRIEQIDTILVSLGN